MIPLRASSRKWPTEWIAAANPTKAVARMQNAPSASTPGNPGPGSGPLERTDQPITRASRVVSPDATSVPYSMRACRSLGREAPTSAAIRGIARSARIILVFSEAGHRERGFVDGPELAVHHAEESSGYRDPYGDIEGNGKLK